MPGLPGSNPELDFELSKKLFDDAHFRPDGLKLYPTMVVEGTELEKWFQEGRFTPYDFDTMVELLVNIKAMVPRYVRISRVLRDIPPQFITGGPRDSLRGLLRERLQERGLKCQCIRCREYGHRARDDWKIGEPQMVRLDYEASDGREIFLSFEDERGTLFGLLRMRVQDRPLPVPGQEQGRNPAIIRELHIFGPEVPLAEQRPDAAQHKGIGRTLLREAERIAADEFRANQMLVLSGAGAREYYRTESGYRSLGEYMVKELKQDS
jgi:elongator complex protein 3